MGFEFLFIHALWALPLAGVPVLLHLLFRRKSPVVPFSTLRFVKTSLQHTAARRKVQRWLLLATRALLLLLLIWAIAQPARVLATNWFGGRSTAAAIVVDTTHSMLYQHEQVPLLDRASTTVETLLRTQLGGASVAIFTSHARPESREGVDRSRLQPSSALLAQWSPLRPEPADQPLASRVNQAVNLLKQNDAAQKWLIVLTDGHAREFPQPLTGLDDLRVAMIDLRPDNARAAGITRVAIDPPQPIPGITCELTVDVAGRSGDARPIAISIRTPDGQTLHQHPSQLVRFDTAGRAQLRLPIELPPQRWLQVVATLQAEDATPADNERTLLVEVPPRQNVTVLDAPAAATAARFAQLALDPAEGNQPAWPLAVARAPQLTGREDVAVALLTRWPDHATATRLRDLARGGGTVVLFVQPGLESTWSDVEGRTQQVLTELLPAAPTTTAPAESVDAAFTVTTTDDALVRAVAAAPEQLADLSVRRVVPFTITDARGTALLRVVRPDRAATPLPLLARKRIGAGRVFTWATLPDTRFTTLPLHPLFLQLMVTSALPPLDTSSAANVELGQPLHLQARQAGPHAQLDLESPTRQLTRVDASDTPTGRTFTFAGTDAAGLYTWRPHDRLDTLALANVQFPAVEADVTYREPAQVVPPADNVVVARSLDELQSKITQLSEPAPRWTWAVALVLTLMCLEALMGSVSKLWSPFSIAGFIRRPRPADPPVAASN